MADKEVQRVREKIRDALIHLVIRDADMITADEAINLIFAIPELCIKADDQSLPTTPFYPRIRQLEAMKITQQDMLKANFVKKVPKGNYEQPKTKDG